MRSTFRVLITLLLVVPVLLSCGTAGSSKEEAGSEKTVLSHFENPGVDAKPMARMWFPDAGAGEDPDDLIEKQILELADKGFGGVEVAMLADGVNYNNAEGKVYGWGSENWSRLLKKVLKAAAKVPGGFQVDMTITAHWPPTLNTLDPNDEAANKELTYSLTRITADDLAGGTISLQLPPQKIDGPAGPFGNRTYDHFLFTDSFVSATVARVSEIKMVAEDSGPSFPGAPPAEPVMKPMPVFDFDSLKTITESVTGTAEGGYAAGVPDRATAEAYGWNYDDILEFFGPESEGPWVSANGKLDAESNRKRMADWQNMYSADLSGLNLPGLDNGTDIQPGDWVVISTFSRGTGQSISGGRIMHNGVFVTNYFNSAGTAALTDFWDAMMDRDPELLELMKANRGYIFEDSIESSSDASYWASTIMEDIPDSYKYKDILPLVAAGKHLSSSFLGTSITYFFGFDGDDGAFERIYEDYNNFLAELYVRYRVTGMVDWADFAFGWGFRGQTYHLPGLEISRAAMVADVAECDNMSKGDGVRYQAGTVNISGRDYLTMEAITGPTIGYVTMDDVITELGQNYSHGVTRAILHGTPYTKSFNGFNSDWPGWLPFGPGVFGSAYTYRQAYWDDVVTETAYMSRIQAVLQEGEARIDLAVLIDKEHTFDFESGNRFQNLLDVGYSYNLISESTLNHPAAAVKNGRLAAEGPAYKALIVDRVSIFSLKAMETLLEYAENGLPVIIYNSDFSRVYGSDVEADAQLQKMAAELTAMAGVKTADSLDEVKAALKALDVEGYAVYDVPQLETTLYEDPADGSRYYYIFNNAFPENSGMMGNIQGANYKGEEKLITNAAVTLNGTGVPYLLDPHTGEVSQLGAYTVGEDDTVSFRIDSLAGGDSMIIALSENSGVFPIEGLFVTNVEGPGMDYAVDRKNGTLSLRSSTAGEYTLTLSDGTSKSVVIEEDLDFLDLSGAEWNLVIDSYGPDKTQNDPGVSLITSVDFGSGKLGKWVDLPATAAQLSEIGVDDMRNVSGTGEYSITFTLPPGWSSDTGAILDVTYGKDQIGSYTVNGTVLQANNASDRVDVGGLLKPGENTLTVKLSSSLYGRMYVENSGYQGREFGISRGFMTPVDPDGYYNGLLTVKLTPYTRVDL